MMVPLGPQLTWHCSSPRSGWRSLRKTVGTCWSVQKSRDMLRFQELVPVLSDVFLSSVVAPSKMVATGGHSSTYLCLILRGVISIKYIPHFKDKERKKNVNILLIILKYGFYFDIISQLFSSNLLIFSLILFMLKSVSHLLVIKLHIVVAFLWCWDLGYCLPGSLKFFQD